MIKKIGQAINRTVERIGSAIAIFCGVLTLLIAIIVTYLVVRRYALGSPEPYSYVVSVILFFICCLLPLCIVQIRQLNIRADFVTNRLSSHVQFLLTYILTPIVGLFYVSLGTLYTWKAAWYSFQLGELTQTVWQIPLFPIKAVVTVGWGLLGLVLLTQLVHGIYSIQKGSYGMRR